MSKKHILKPKAKNDDDDGSSKPWSRSTLCRMIFFVGLLSVAAASVAIYSAVKVNDSAPLVGSYSAGSPNTSLIVYECGINYNASYIDLQYTDSTVKRNLETFQIDQLLGHKVLTRVTSGLNSSNVFDGGVFFGQNIIDGAHSMVLAPSVNQQIAKRSNNYVYCSAFTIVDCNSANNGCPSGLIGINVPHPKCNLDVFGSTCLSGNTNVTGLLTVSGNLNIVGGNITVNGFPLNVTGGSGGACAGRCFNGSTGLQGPQGPAGNSGASANIALVNIDPGANCTFGGVQVSTGTNGVFNQTANICNGNPNPGAAGSNGTSGNSSFVNIVTLGPGVACPAGGYTISTGISGYPSTNQLVTLCDAQQGATGSTGSPGPAGPKGDSSNIVQTVFSGATFGCSNGGILFSTYTNNVLTAANAICTPYNGSTGTPGINGTSPYQLLVNFTYIAPGNACANGGMNMTTGYDTNKNGFLDPTEIINTFNLCNGVNGTVGLPGQSGTSSLLNVITLGLNDTNCRFGGLQIDTVTNNVSQTNYVCNGQNGGIGPSGDSALVQVTPILPGVICAKGGYLIGTGFNGYVNATNSVCNGVDGLNGQNATSSLLSVTTLPIGDVNCPEGGLLIVTGTLLSPQHNYVCNGLNGNTTYANVTSAYVVVTNITDIHICANGGYLIGTGYNGVVYQNSTICNGVDGIAYNGSQGVPGNSSLLNVYTVAPGNTSTCLYGGLQIDTGANNVVLQTNYLCNAANGSVGQTGASGSNAYIQVTPIFPGNQCGNGGYLLGTGSNNLVLTNTTICNGVNGISYNGSQGAPGQNGTSSLINVIPLLFGDVNCPFGGLEIQTGSGVTVTQTNFLCASANGSMGTQGIPGLNGNSTYIVVTNITAGATCSQGGVLIGTGFNGVVFFNNTLCNGVDGGQGPQGQQGAAGNSPYLQVLTLGLNDSHCISGGLAVNTGFNNTVYQTNYVCNGITSGNGTNAYIQISNITAGSTCAAGGYLIATGYNNIVTQNTTVCQGINGTLSYNGSTGSNGIIIVSVILPGDPICPAGNGGLEIQTGTNGTVLQVNYLCNAYNGSVGGQGTSGLNGTNAYIVTSNITAGVICANGGVLIGVGFEGVVNQNTTVCNGVAGAVGMSGQNGSNAAISVTVLSVGDANCPTGGLDIGTGVGVVTIHNYLCNAYNGSVGPQGQSGFNGSNAYIVVSNITAGPICSAGGYLVGVGSNNVVNTNFTVCNGVAGLTGQSGVNGNSSLLMVTVLLVGDLNCVNGGLKIDTGLGNTITQTNYLCNAYNGSTGAQGQTGLAGTNAYITASNISAGPTCSSGGILLGIGFNGNVTQNFTICAGVAGLAGQNGSQGPMGPSGASPVIFVTPLSVNDTNCPTGGLAIGTGPNGTVTQINYVCNGAIGQNGNSAYIVVSNVTNLSICANGGSLVGVGYNNAVLQNITVCNGIGGLNGSSPLLSVLPLSIGDVHCANGGIEVGTGILSITQFNYICNGYNGSTGGQGPTGVNGTSAYVNVTVLTSGLICSNGGYLVGVGYNGIVTQNVTLCNGQNGINGINATTFLFNLTTIVGPSGACPFNGTLIQGGLDLNFDNILEPSEVTVTSYACNGYPGLSAFINQTNCTSTCAANCAAANGGLILTSGQGNNVIQTTYLCNGATGSQGQPGANASQYIFQSSVVFPGDLVNCPAGNGGFVLTGGYNTTAGFVSQITRIVCNGANGTDYNATADLLEPPAVQLGNFTLINFSPPGQLNELVYDTTTHTWTPEDRCPLVSDAIFGDGSDGPFFLAPGLNYTMTRNMYWTTAYISDNATLYPAGWQIFVQFTLTIGGTIDASGNAGVAHSNTILGSYPPVCTENPDMTYLQNKGQTYLQALYSRSQTVSCGNIPATDNSSFVGIVFSSSLSICTNSPFARGGPSTLKNSITSLAWKDVAGVPFTGGDCTFPAVQEQIDPILGPLGYQKIGANAGLPGDIVYISAKYITSTLTKTGTITAAGQSFGSANVLALCNAFHLLPCPSFGYEQTFYATTPGNGGIVYINTKTPSNLMNVTLNVNAGGFSGGSANDYIPYATTICGVSMVWNACGFSRIPVVINSNGKIFYENLCGVVPEVCNNLDDNYNGLVDEIDQDADGFWACGNSTWGPDCNDLNNGAQACLLNLTGLNALSCSCVANNYLYVCSNSTVKDCNGQSVDGCETNVINNTANCGVCGNSCGQPFEAIVGCNVSSCVIFACKPGFADLDGVFSNGCEYDLTVTFSLVSQNVTFVFNQTTNSTFVWVIQPQSGTVGRTLQLVGLITPEFNATVWGASYIFPQNFPATANSSFSSNSTTYSLQVFQPSNSAVLNIYQSFVMSSLFPLTTFYFTNFTIIDTSYPSSVVIPFVLYYTNNSVSVAVIPNTLTISKTIDGVLNDALQAYQVATLTITFTADVLQPTIVFFNGSDQLPPNMFVYDNVTNVVNNCGGALILSTTFVSLSNASLAAGQTCLISCSIYTLYNATVGANNVINNTLPFATFTDSGVDVVSTVAAAAVTVSQVPLSLLASYATGPFVVYSNISVSFEFFPASLILATPSAIPNNVVPINFQLNLTNGFIFSSSAVTMIGVGCPSIANSTVLTVGSGFANISALVNYSFVQLSPGNCQLIFYISPTLVGSYVPFVIPVEGQFVNVANGQFVTNAGCLSCQLPVTSTANLLTVTKTLNNGIVNVQSYQGIPLVIQFSASSTQGRTAFFNGSDIFPPQMFIYDNTTNFNNTCGGILSTSNQTSLTLTGGSLAPGASCYISCTVYCVYYNSTNSNVTDILPAQAFADTNYDVVSTFAGAYVIVSQLPSLPVSFASPSQFTIITGSTTAQSILIGPPSGPITMPNYLSSIYSFNLSFALPVSLFIIIGSSNIIFSGSCAIGNSATLPLDANVVNIPNVNLTLSSSSACNVTFYLYLSAPGIYPFLMNPIYAGEFSNVSNGDLLSTAANWTFNPIYLFDTAPAVEVAANISFFGHYVNQIVTYSFSFRNTQAVVLNQVNPVSIIFPALLMMRSNPLLTFNSIGCSPTTIFASNGNNFTISGINLPALAKCSMSISLWSGTPGSYSTPSLPSFSFCYPGSVGCNTFSVSLSNINYLNQYILVDSSNKTTACTSSIVNTGAEANYNAGACSIIGNACHIDAPCNVNSCVHTGPNCHCLVGITACGSGNNCAATPLCPTNTCGCTTSSIITGAPAAPSTTCYAYCY